MYKRVYFDFFNHKIHLWESSGDSTKYEVLNHSMVYYIQDKSGKSQIKDVYGNPVIRQSSFSFKKIRELRESGAKLCESDINECVKFLHDRYEGKTLSVNINSFNIANIDIEVASIGKFPESEYAEFPINLITVKFSKTNKIYTFGINEYTGNDKTFNYCKCDGEIDLITKFCDFFKHVNPDIIIGWNVVDFDVKYIINRKKKLCIDNTLSPLGLDEVNEYGVSVAGVVMLDYLMLYKELDKTPLENYMLDTVSKHVIGEGKIVLESGINNEAKTNWNNFVEYNVHDVLLVDKIDAKLRLIELAISFAYQSLVPIEKVASTIQLITGYMLKYLHAKKVVLNDKPHVAFSEYPGAYNYSRPGDYKNVMSLDIESMYPHIIMMGNISPETKVKFPENTDGLIKTPIEGLYYKKDIEGIIPQISKELFNDRKKFNTKKKIKGMIDHGISDEDIVKKIKVSNELISDVKSEGYTYEFYNSQQYIRKILVNSVYGVLGNEGFHFYDVDNASAVTMFGQDLIKYLSNSLDGFYEPKIKSKVVVLVDTDSCYIEIGNIAKFKNIDISSNTKLIDFAYNFYDNELKPYFKDILDKYAEKYNTKNIINFKREKTITRIIALKKKRYVAEYIESEGTIYSEPQHSFTGVEVVRSSTPEFCRGKLKEEIINIFKFNDKNKILSDIAFIKEEFYKQDIEKISCPRNVREISKYQTDIGNFVIPTKYPQHVKAALIYNYFIKIFDLPLQPVYDGTKIKFIYVIGNNNYNVNVVGFIGKYPDIYKKYFKINYEQQFQVNFINVIDDIFEHIGWGKVEFEQVDDGGAIVW